MAYRRNPAKVATDRRWSTLVQEHAGLINGMNLPSATFDSLDRFYHFLYHDGVRGRDARTVHNFFHFMCAFIEARIHLRQGEQHLRMPIDGLPIPHQLRLRELYGPLVDGCAPHLLSP